MSPLLHLRHPRTALPVIRAPPPPCHPDMERPDARGRGWRFLLGREQMRAAEGAGRFDDGHPDIRGLLGEPCRKTVVRREKTLPELASLGASSRSLG